MRRGKTRTLGGSQMPKWLFSTMLSLALAPTLVLGQTMMNLASMPVFFTCLAQEPELRQKFMAESRARNPDIPADAEWTATPFGESSWALCVRHKKWVSKPFCSDLFEANAKGTRRDIARVMDQHWAEYQGLKPMVDYFEAAFPKGGVEASAPVSCPE